ncbi:hypothetical protein Q5H92_08895 [Hymenobacter sp. M29]|uniref:Phage terminase large subunit N-terminal domain-containing protein n=1 Tax=Hymenobacter mellowenesis TaxID=3063995 RepID=A0ABT9ACM2_9BACT|nr:hypothetical protein [Hymenobacter sp. M29]MDO7846472.1 hypothetical protein [Hymenobacter sp. M29]
MILTLKQTTALDLLEDHESEVTEVLFGGGAGGGKSGLGCYHLVKNAIKYPGSRWLMGREELQNLKETTLVTLWDILRMQNVPATAYRYYEQKKRIDFKNGSAILLRELKYEPSDKDFDSLGSLEVTGGFIDEIPRIVQKAWQVVKSRIRYKLDHWCHRCGRLNHPAKGKRGQPDHPGNEVLRHDDTGKPVLWRCRQCGTITSGLRPKLLGSCNPSKTWVYRYFYKPNKEGTLPAHKAFVPSLLSDNPHVSAHYRQSLLDLDKASLQRLLLGNWEYDDDPDALMHFDAINDLFQNQHVPATGKRYITADVSRFGGDTIRLGVWDGWRCVKRVKKAKQSTTQTAADIRALATEYRVPMSQVLVDEDGVGGGVLDQLPGAKGFLNGSRPLPNPHAKTFEERKRAENFEHLKAQCTYGLAGKVNAAEVWIMDATEEEQQFITEELEQVKRKDADKDGKLRIVPKDVVKQALGRSPDTSDMLMMRFWFELKPAGSGYDW